MNERALSILQAAGLEKPNGRALYLVSRAPFGLLLEDFAPLLRTIESLYRRSFALTVDSESRRELLERLGDDRRIRGFGGRLNRFYRAATVPKSVTYYPPVVRPDEQGYLRPIHQLKPSRVSSTLSEPRIELTRARFESPGFFELLANPVILAGLISLIVVETRNWEQHEDTIALKEREQRARENAERRADIELLLRLGYSQEEIAAVSEYLGRDISGALRRLKETRSLLAPGDLLEEFMSGEATGRTESTGVE